MKFNKLYIYINKYYKGIHNQENLFSTILNLKTNSFR